MSAVLTTGEDEVWGAQQYVGESLQEAEVHQVGEEADSHHEYWESFKNIETCQHTCRELHTFTQTVKTGVCLGILLPYIHKKQVHKENGMTIFSLTHHYHVLYYSTGGYCVFFY